MGLVHLQGLTNLRSLVLDETKITGEGLVYLSGLPNLEVLWLEGTKITRRGLVYLKRLTNLKMLCIAGAELPIFCGDGLGKSLPNCDIRGRTMPQRAL